MHRIAENRLESWFAAGQTPRRKPLVLRGARQVGKSTLVRNHAKQKGLCLNEVNLERHRSLDKIFASLDMTVIRHELEALVGGSITQPNSVLFLDEIQATPHALPVLRYFYEDLPDVPVLAAGSLLEFTLSDHSFSMPVGRIEYHHLGPMTFREFLRAIEPPLLKYLDEIDFEHPLTDSAHQKLSKRHRQYLFVGGMPEAVLVFQETGSLEEATAIHRSIVATYEDDFAKYARKNELTLLQRVFRLVPRFVGQKVKYTNFSRESRSRDVKAAIDKLIKARVCLPVHASHCSGVPLHADINEKAYKLLFLDVGLMNHVCGVDWLILQQMDQLRLVNEGAIAEQVVGQHLAYAALGTEKPRPVYWLREGRATNAEVDYVMSRGPHIFPIEVKAGKSGTLRSLHQFVLEKKARVALRLDTNKPSHQTVSHQVRTRRGQKTAHFHLYSIPLYAAGEMTRLLDDIRQI